ncbi:MAG: hypothetical protein LBJ00_07225 [Planctomycetaceae bacterium]|jgi:hypothetical protein|nr:hypothetical protein [Planctomycetaceae bacterium]
MSKTKTNFVSFSQSPKSIYRYGNFSLIIPKLVWAVGFALEQPLRDATLACSASGISKQLEYKTISTCLNINVANRVARIGLSVLFLMLISFLFTLGKTSAVCAAEAQRKPVVSAAQLQLIERAQQIVEKITKPEDKLGKFFELLAFESQFEDKQYARKSIQIISKQIAALEAGAVKNNFYELLAIAQSSIGDYSQIDVTLNNLPQTADKSQIQFDIAEKILYEHTANKLPIPVEVTYLLQFAYAGAGVAKNVELEVLAAMQLGRVLAQNGKNDEAKKLLNIALKKSDELEEAESQNIKQSILRIMVQNKIYKEVNDELTKTKSQETKDLYLGIVLQTLAEEGEIEKAVKGLAGIKLADIKDMIAVGISRELAKKGTVAELLELSKQTSSEERKEIFVQNTISFLLQNNRNDITAQLINQSGAKPASLERYNLILIANLVEEKKFDEAEKMMAKISDENYKMKIRRYMILSRIKANGLKSVIGKAILDYTDETKQQIKALNAETAKLPAIENNSERAKAGFTLLLKQVEILNPDGIDAVNKVFANDIDKLDIPAQILEYQYNTARLHFELGNFDGVREMLDRSVKYLNGINDLMALKNLVFAEEETASTNGVAANNTTTGNANMPNTPKNQTPEITEAMIRERLFSIYTSICAMYIDINEIGTAAKIYEQSKKYLAVDNNDLLTQFNQTGVLSKLLLQLDETKSIIGK